MRPADRRLVRPTVAALLAAASLAPQGEPTSPEFRGP